MSNRDNSLYIVDIFIAIDKILRYTKNFNCGDDLLCDEMSWDATIRELEIIGEATKMLLNQNILKEEYRRIVDFRNQIIHGYFGIDAEIVWDVVVHKLPSYKTDLQNIITTTPIDLTEAIICAKSENKNNPHVLALLSQI